MNEYCIKIMKKLRGENEDLSTGQDIRLIRIPKDTRTKGYKGI